MNERASSLLEVILRREVARVLYSVMNHITYDSRGLS